MNLAHIINLILKPIGIKIVSNKHERNEEHRLMGLRNRGHWLQAKYTEGLDLDEERFLKFLYQVCSPYYDNIRLLPRYADEARDGYYLNNLWFGPIDGSVLYSVIRHFRPNNIIEIGSGFSTRLMRVAINDGRIPTSIISIDPEPRIDIHHFADTILSSRVEDISVECIVDKLKTNDILFIDSSHTIVTGGDVPFLFLEVIPRVSPGVLIHIHDIFFPYDYPEEWVFSLRTGWNEQYLVHAFLAFNNTFEILWAGNYIWRNRRDEIIAAIPHAANATGAGSLWLRRK